MKDKCKYLEDVIEVEYGDCIGEDEFGYPIYETVPVIKAEFCTNFCKVNPDCANCENCAK